jgi:hypothetical protein
VNRRAATAVLLPLAAAAAAGEPAPGYPWLEGRTPARSLAAAFAPPAGYRRVAAAPGSFAEWLRGLPLQPGGAAVRLHDGRPKPNQAAHAAVLDLDTGTRDLQQCADAAIRLRAEYLFSRRRFDAIRFRFTDGTPAAYPRWRDGERPVVSAAAVRWAAAAPRDETYASFRAYLDTVFAYAGTRSLARDLPPRSPAAALRIGDVFVQGGSPGHAAIVVDLARDPHSGRAAFLLAQGFMPAQDVHVLRNPADPALSPWYERDFGGRLDTPEWTFRAADLRHWGEE